MGHLADPRVPLTQRSSAAALDLALAAGLGAVVASTFAPWGRSGEARRSSHELVRAADRLEVLGPPAQSVASVAWAVLPLVAALIVLALVRHRRLAAGIGALVLAVPVALVALAFTRHLPGADWGVLASLLSSTTLAGTAIVVIASARRSGTHERIR